MGPGAPPMRPPRPRPTPAASIRMMTPSPRAPGGARPRQQRGKRRQRGPWRASPSSPPLLLLLLLLPWLCLLLLLQPSVVVAGFQAPPGAARPSRRPATATASRRGRRPSPPSPPLPPSWWQRPSSSALQLAPLPLPEEQANAFTLPLGYKLGLIEPRDLPALVGLLMACFPPDMPMEFPKGSGFLDRRVLRPLYHLTAGVATATARFELRYGLLSRNGERFARCDLAPSEESLMLGVGEELTGRLVAVVELCLRPPDGNLIPSIRGPTVRYDASCRPYLCNLAVAPAYRGQGLGRALALHAERVARDVWGQRVIYLHLDETDPAAASLYASLGYGRVLGVAPTGWYNQMMFEEAARVGKRLCYYSKALASDNDNEAAAAAAAAAEGG